MEILSAPRGTGKTTKLVDRLLEDPMSVIVVATHRESVRPIVEAVMRRKGLLHMERDEHNEITPGQKIPMERIEEVMQRVLSCDAVPRIGPHPLRGRRVLVDDLEDVLHYWLGADVHTATMAVRG